MSNQTTSFTDTWYRVTPDSSNNEITVLSADISSAAITDISLYSGTCVGLILRSGTIENSEHLTTTYAGLTIGGTYYLKLTKGNTSATSFDVCLIGLRTSAITCPTGCPPNPNNNVNNSCEATCNGGFEYNVWPPHHLHGIDLACPWNKTNQAATPDLFNVTIINNSMNTGLWVKVPNNFAGYQHPKAGNGYAGFIAFDAGSPNNYREYVVEPLAVPLQAGKRYRVSFWVNLGNYAGFKTSGMGAFLSPTDPNVLTYSGIGALNPQIKGSLYNTTIGDTANWVLITDTITPAVTMNYIAIGCFKNYATNGHTAVPHQASPFPAQGAGGLAYYFVDEVSIVPDAPFTFNVSPNPSCQGTPVTISVTNPLSNNVYLWSATNSTAFACYGTSNCDTIKTTLPNNSTTKFTATTLLPSYGWCSVYDTVRPQWLAGPVSVNAGTDQSICLGASAVLTGSATGGYTTTSWSVLNSSTICSGCTTATVSPTTTTQYVFTATNTATGCSRKDTMKVTVTPLTVSIVTPAGATTCGGCFSFTTATAYTTYSWSTNAVSSTGGSTSTLNACWGMPFDTSGLNGNVSVSIVAANGCQGTAYLIIPSCCPFKDGQESSFANLINDSTTRVDNVTYPSLYTYNAVTQYYEATNKQFSINGVYTVDKNTRWLGCEVKMGPNAKIMLRPGIKFEMTNSTGMNFTKVYACTDMWDGIYVDGTNAATKLTVLNGTVIEDAKNAIVSSNGGNFLIDGGSFACKFNKNNIGIWVKVYSGTHPGIIRKAIFSCDAPGQAGATAGVTFSGANCRAPVSGKGLAGVYIEDCNAVAVGDSTSNNYRNLFERTQFGVYSKGSNVKVWNNDFKYFTATVINKNVPPNGIAVFSSAAKFTPKTITVGRQGNYKAKNKFTKCSYGVYANNYINLNCEFNRFDSCMNAGITTMNCQNNTIFINKDTLKECTGTNIQCVQSTSSTITITYNQINNTSSFALTNFGNTGIYVAQSAITPVNLFIQNNTIQKMRNGIWVSRVDKCKVADNTATFLAGQPTSQLSPCIGIKLEEVTNSLIRQNAVQISTTPTAAVHDEIFGIHVTNCKNDTISKNTLSKMGTGIFLKGTDNPSILACNTLSNCWYGINFNYLNGYGAPVSLNDQITWTSSNTPYSTGNTWSTTTGGKDLIGRIQLVSGNGIRWYYTSYNPDYSAMFFLSIFNNATTYTGNGDRCSFMLAPPTQGATAIRDYTLSGICKMPRTYDTLNTEFQYHDKVFAFRMLRNNPSWMTLGTPDDSYYSSFYSTQSSTNIGKFANVEDSIAVSKITGAAAMLATITPSGQYEINRKALLEVYLQTWAVDNMNLDSAQQSVLLGIIHQGMLIGGTSVFDARNMLMLEVHDSSGVRLQQPTSTPYMVPVISNAYPNPTNGSVSIKMEINEDQNGTFDIIDLSGRIVGSWQFTGGQGTYTFDASYLPSGTYLYRIQSCGEMLKSDRLVIIRE